MTDEEKKALEEQKKQTEETHDADYYIEAIKSLKENSVDRDKYDAKVAENKKLVEALVNGEQLEKGGDLPEKKSAAEIRNELFGKGSENLSNLDYWSKALDLREAILDEGGEDPFLPWGHKIAPTQDDIAAVDRVVKGVQSCIDYADGDSQIFTDELQRITIDSTPLVKRARKK